jgi:opacity protein-like surface antigen
MFRTGSAGMAVAGLLCLAGAVSPATAQTRLDGAYVGLQAGSVFFDSTVNTRRRIRGRELRFEQQEDGVLAGARLGYGWRSAAGLYLGAELEGLWGVDVDGGSSLLGIAYQGSYEGEGSGFVRLGYVLGDAVLLYARGGATYERYEMGINGGRRSASRVAPAFGVGLEVAVLESFSIRLDGTYSPPTGGSFEVEKYALTAGIGWYFWSPR